jgi:heme exporter protein B
MRVSTWRKAWALVRKDLVLEWRTRGSLVAMLLLGVMAGLILSLAMEGRAGGAREVAPGALWVTLAFVGTLGLSCSMAREHEDGGLEGLMLVPVDAGLVYAAKAAANALTMLGVGAALLPCFSLFLGVNLLKPDLLVILLLGTAGLAGVGTLLSAMVVPMRGRESLLPVLLLPVVVPLVIGAVRATGGVIEGEGLRAVAAWLRLMAAFDLTLGAVAYLLFAYVMEG